MIKQIVSLAALMVMSFSPALALEENLGISGIIMSLNRLKDGNVEVFGIFKNTPADEAKIEPGDEIVEVNGKLVKGTDLDTLLSDIHFKQTPTGKLEFTRSGDPITLKLISKNGERTVTMKLIGYNDLHDVLEIFIQEFRDTFGEENISFMVL